MVGDRLVIFIIFDVIKMALESVFDSSGSLSHVLNITYFACYAIDQVGTSATDIRHCVELLFSSTTE